MKQQEFEALVGEGFRLQGYLVIAVARGEADLVLEKGKETFFVQLRHWRAPEVDVGAVRELHGAMTAGGAAGGFIVTTGKFSPAAVEFANASGIRLVSGKSLDAMLEQAKQTITLPLRIEPRLGPANPACPRCGRPMVQRIAQQGAQAGKPFWGCSAFPDCRGTLPAE